MPETWIEITEDHVLSALAEGELEVFSSVALAPGSSLVLPDCIRRVVNRIRGDIAASGRYALGPGGFLPPEMESAAIHLLRREIASRVPQAEVVFDKLRLAALEDVDRQLECVREGKAGITPPVAVSPTAPAQDSGGWGGSALIHFGPDYCGPDTSEDNE